MIKKFLRGFLIGLAAIFVVLNLVIILTGRFYIYSGLQHTYFKGRKGPAITDREVFPVNTIEAGPEQPWKFHAEYNKHTISEDMIANLDAYETTSLLVIQNGEIRHEQYWRGFDKETTSNSLSIAKSIVALLIGSAMQDGLIDNLDQPVSDFLDGYKDNGKEKITLRHLLTMSSGLNWVESSVNPFSDNAEAYYGSDLWGQIEGLERVDEPGVNYIYQGGNSQSLAFVVEKLSGTSVSEYASKKLWKPLGAKTSGTWSLDKEGGHEKAFCCFYATARDFARLGQLAIQKGAWNGHQLVPKNFMELSTQPATELMAKGKKNMRYGYHWWTDQYKNLDYYYARGILGQYIIVIPDYDLVVFRAGHIRGEKNERGHPIDMYHYIDAALTIIG